MRLRTKRMRCLLTLAAASALILSACGDDDDVVQRGLVEEPGPSDLACPETGDLPPTPGSAAEWRIAEGFAGKPSGIC